MFSKFLLTSSSSSAFFSLNYSSLPLLLPLSSFVFSLFTLLIQLFSKLIPPHFFSFHCLSSFPPHTSFPYAVFFISPLLLFSFLCLSFLHFLLIYYSPFAVFLHFLLTYSSPSVVFLVNSSSLPLLPRLFSQLIPPHFLFSFSCLSSFTPHIFSPYTVFLISSLLPFFFFRSLSSFTTYFIFLGCFLSSFLLPLLLPFCSSFTTRFLFSTSVYFCISSLHLFSFRFILHLTISSPAYFILSAPSFILHLYLAPSTVFYLSTPVLDLLLSLIPSF